MKEIIQGIGDYIKDCRHDKNFGSKTARPAYMDWKEGNVWHYIKQRKIAKQKKGL